MSVIISPLLLLHDKNFHSLFAADVVIETAEVVAGRMSLIVTRIEMIRNVEVLQSSVEAILPFEAAGR
jgi:hypothetical protein